MKAKTTADLAKALDISIHRVSNVIADYELAEGVLCPRGPNNERLIPPEMYDDIVAPHERGRVAGVAYATLLAARGALRHHDVEARLRSTEVLTARLVSTMTSLGEQLSEALRDSGERLQSLSDLRKEFWTDHQAEQELQAQARADREAARLILRAARDSSAQAQTVLEAKEAELDRRLADLNGKLGRIEGFERTLFKRYALLTAEIKRVQGSRAVPLNGSDER